MRRKVGREWSDPDEGRHDAWGAPLTAGPLGEGHTKGGAVEPEALATVGGPWNRKPSEHYPGKVYTRRPFLLANPGSQGVE